MSAFVKVVIQARAKGEARIESDEMSFFCDDVVIENVLERCDQPGDKYEEWRPTGDVVLKLKGVMGRSGK